MVESTFSERGWVWTGKLIEKTVSCLGAMGGTDARMVNTDVRQSEGELSHPTG
jgi:proteasome activator subunit 4